MRCSGRVVTWSFVIGGPQTRFSRIAQLLHRNTSTNLPLCRWQVDVLSPQMAISKPASSHCVASMPMAVDNVLGNGTVRISWWNQIGIIREGRLRIDRWRLYMELGLYCGAVLIPLFNDIINKFLPNQLYREAWRLLVHFRATNHLPCQIMIGSRCCPWDILIPDYPSGCSRKMKMSKKKTWTLYKCPSAVLRPT